MDQKNPVVYVNGGRKYKMYQFLSEKIGLSALRAHLWQTIGIGSVVTDYVAFDRAFYRRSPRPSRTSATIRNCGWKASDARKPTPAPGDPE